MDITYFELINNLIKEESFTLLDSKEDRTVWTRDISDTSSVNIVIYGKSILDESPELNKVAITLWTSGLDNLEKLSFRSKHDPELVYNYTVKFLKSLANDTN